MAGWPIGAWLALADASLVLGIWPDLGALMLAAFVLPAALLFHPFWTHADPAQRWLQEVSFYRNITLFGAALALFVFFSVAAAGRFAITGSLVDLH